MNTTTRIYSWSTALLLLAMLACIAIPASAASGMGPQITIMEPKDGSELASGDVTISVQVQNFSLVNKLGKPSVAGEGHIHYFMDAAAPTTEGKPAITASGTFAPTPNTTLTWKNVTAGMHNFSVELANNDHTPLVPAVVAEVNVTVGKMTLKTMSEKNMSAENVTIGLIAKNMAFNTSTIIVPAGAHVIIDFDNQDANIPHNFALYENKDASKSIFVGEVVSEKKIVYTFDAPQTPGTYFFRCDIHPTIMTGDFIVE